MTIDEKLKRFILYKYGTMKNFQKETGIPASTLSSIFKRGILNTTTDKIFTICDTLNISIDELVKNGRIVSNKDKAEFSDFEKDYFSLSDYSKEIIKSIMDFDLNQDSFTVLNRDEFYDYMIKQPIEPIEPTEPILIAASGAEDATEEDMEHNLDLARKIARGRKGKEEEE